MKQAILLSACLYSLGLFAQLETPSEFQRDEEKVEYYQDSIENGDSSGVYYHWKSVETGELSHKEGKSIGDKAKLKYYKVTKSGQSYDRVEKTVDHKEEIKENRRFEYMEGQTWRFTPLEGEIREIQITQVETIKLESEGIKTLELNTGQTTQSEVKDANANYYYAVKMTKLNGNTLETTWKADQLVDFSKVSNRFSDEVMTQLLEELLN